MIRAFDDKDFNKYLLLAQRKKEILLSELKDNSIKLSQQREALILLEKVHIVLNNMESSLRGNFITYVQDLISYGITLVFEKDMRFVIKYRTRANTPIVEFAIESQGIETDIYGATGGGLINVVSFLLRLILLIYANPPLQRIIFLDESFSMVSSQYLPNVAALLKEMSIKMDMNIVLISHQSIFRDVANRIYEISKDDSISTATLIKGRQ